jgi:hypothetical protein
MSSRAKAMRLKIAGRDLSSLVKAKTISHPSSFDRHRKMVNRQFPEAPSNMTTEEMLTTAAVHSWKVVISRFDGSVASLSPEQLQKEVAPGKNRLLYLVGHLTAIHDRMFPLLGLGERLHPELDEIYISNPDRALPDSISASALKQAWTEVNSKLTAAFEKLTPQQWLEKHTAVSNEDFVKDPTRNRLAVLLSRTNHAAFHTGQAALAK